MKQLLLLQYTFIKSKQVLAFLSACCLFSFFQKVNAQQHGVFYAVTGNGLKDTSYLFGTYHLIKSSYLDNKPSVKYAFNQSAQIVVEVIVDSSQLAAANAKGLLKEKQLTDLLDKNFSDSLDIELKQNIGVGLDQFNAVKPMTVMITLSIVQLMKDNQQVMKKYTGSTLDISFVEKGKAAGKTITPLETILEQMDFLFNKQSDEKQAEHLKAYIRNKNENFKMGIEMLQAYFNNDLTAMYKIYQEGVSISGDMDYLIKDRNFNWLKVLPFLMKKQSSFIAVGALHLAGPDGLVNQLLQMGYTVTPLNL